MKHDAIGNLVQCQVQPMIIMEKNDTYYYQPQPPADYNQFQQYRNNRIIERDPYITDDDKQKVDTRGVTKSGLHSFEIK